MMFQKHAASTEQGAAAPRTPRPAPGALADAPAAVLGPLGLWSMLECSGAARAENELSFAKRIDKAVW